MTQHGLKPASKNVAFCALYSQAKLWRLRSAWWARAADHCSRSTMLTAKLCKACEGGNVREVEELLASGATPNFAPSGNGCRYPLHYAATGGHVEIVKLLLQVRAPCSPRHGSSVDFSWLRSVALLMWQTLQVYLLFAGSCVSPGAARSHSGSFRSFQWLDPADDSCVSYTRSTSRGIGMTLLTKLLRAK